MLHHFKARFQKFPSDLMFNLEKNSYYPACSKSTYNSIFSRSNQSRNRLLSMRFLKWNLI